VTRRQEHEEIEILENLEAIAVGQSILLESINANLAALVALLTPPVEQAVTANLYVNQGVPMPDLTLTFVDATGTAAAPPKGDGTGLNVAFSSDGTTTVGAGVASGDTVVAPLTVVDDSSVSNLTAVVSNVSGAVLLDDDGVTPFVQPPAFAFTAPAPPPPAQATTATLSVA
jgi:hypothetical protein